MSEHECQLPIIENYVATDEDWKCPECGQDWFVGSKNYCYSCNRSDGPMWERYGTGDGGFPKIQVSRGGIKFNVSTDWASLFVNNPGGWG